MESSKEWIRRWEALLLRSENHLNIELQSTPEEEEVENHGTAN